MFVLAEDHPRSRGVYPQDRPADGRGRGSSPLARGLPANAAATTLHLRIIPARAGFTVLPAEWVPPARDHPRSRGVYRPAQADEIRRAGSSPLARGLQVGAGDSPRRGRIIPARAGFTHHDHHHDRRREDHPRSRGVYPSCPTPRVPPEGSSPLARGLRPGRVRAWLAIGIIPARAGFTTACGRRSRWTRDHPRSRGVYAIETDLCSHGDGSSPLARGLRSW